MTVSGIPIAAARGSARLWTAAGLLFAVPVVSAAVIGADRYGRSLAMADLDGRAASTLPLAATVLSGEISKQQLLPAVLAVDSDVVALLRSPDDQRARAMSAKLKALAAEAGASVLYLVGRDGITLAASNFDAPDSFVGSDYDFRTYFTAAMASGRGLQYALGTVSRRPGLYLSHRVDGPPGALGVVVVKVELDRVEANWRESGYTVYAFDPQGIVLATSRPDWRFGLLAPLADEDAARRALQLGDTPLTPVPLKTDSDGFVLIGPGDARAHFAVATGPVGAVAPEWRMTVLVPADAAVASTSRTAISIALAALLAVIAVGVAVQRRRLSIRRRQAALSAMNTELERRVLERTGELSHANTALAGEIEVREAAEQRVRRLRDELAQANRLSILGQIAAGVAHEINQPVAAIRAYADNAGRMIETGRTDQARENMGAIARMADRIGEITGTLRGFARRATSPMGPVRLDDAIEGALSLLAGRIRDSGVALERRRAAPDLIVLASRIRLEQILVNLLQNALDAVKGQAEGRILISVESDDAAVLVRVADNGPGIPADVAETLFMPFVTTKEAGLGLGLVISSEIAREFGGALRFEPGDAEGAVFVLELRLAP
ncbi:two-component system, NtrC family, C4-dicarboxylate transport sensor histidine kinase DctB [Kaistia soli DSM 19436]|uniref:histidine kinase n=1 Tax=Kaistia soli DSM 19436 TaxID=1122133 RepID=A0A1M4YWN0_9HYPH|nr:ATP-binding protein [Kaistia soli]SHF10211.1 two-component system, NtrC family, C4-dicarboxylate transport sensor histidine kinase DctB [Kaistia soli DSM 19436]